MVKHRIIHVIVQKSRPPLDLVAASPQKNLHQVSDVELERNVQDRGNSLLKYSLGVFLQNKYWSYDDMQPLQSHCMMSRNKKRTSRAITEHLTMRRVKQICFNPNSLFKPHILFTFVAIKKKMFSSHINFHYSRVRIKQIHTDITYIFSI